MSQLLHTFYRRRFMDGRHHVFHSYGPGRMIRDDAEVLVFDWSHGPPQRLTNVLGWSTGPRAHLFDHRALRAYGRAWWWRSRPLNITQVYDPAGKLIIQRVDFASPSYTIAGAVYQTDLYLDCFVANDGISFIVEDEDEVIEAEHHGLLSSQQRHAIEAELASVVARIQAGRWLAWLNQTAGLPFDHRVLTQPRAYDGYWQTAATYWPEDWDPGPTPSDNLPTNKNQPSGGGQEPGP